MNVPLTLYLSWSVIVDYLSGEGTLFVNVVSHTSLSWGLEAESRVAHEPGGKCCSVLTPDVENAQELMSLPGLAGLESTLPVQVDGGLLLESPLILIGHSDFSAIVVLHDRPLISTCDSARLCHDAGIYNRAMQREGISFFIGEAKILYLRGMNRELWVAPIPGLPCFT